ncbi:MAG: DMT family transporter, partial [Tannerellaceae bacterium]
MTKDKMKGHILILITNILFAINIPISKFLLPTHVAPEGLTIMRMTFACAMFWLSSLFFTHQKVTMKDLGTLFICALCGVGLNQGLFIVGLNRTSPVDASIIATAVPIFVMLLAALILKEPITQKKAFGVFIGATGGITLILSS